MSGKHKKLLFLALLTTLFTFLLIGFGNVVTRTQSGLGCGDHWPTCNGDWIPDLTNMYVAIEFFHRILAAFVGFFVLILTVWCWLINNPRYARSIRNLSILAVILLAVQIVLGGLTVRYHLPPSLVVFHNGTSIAFFGSLVFLTYRIYQLSASPSSLEYWTDDKDGSPSSLVPLTGALSGLVLGQILLGAYVRHSGSRGGCPEVIPFCEGWNILPSLTKPAVVHFSHRLLGMMIGVLFLYLLYRAVREGSRLATSLAITECLLVGLQILSGLMSIWTASWTLVIWSTVHLLTATLIFGILIVLLAAVKPLNPAPYMQSLAVDEPKV
jgi:cytochrome c oxidase assembly protein subunit 15